MVAKATAPRRENVPGHILFCTILRIPLFLKKRIYGLPALTKGAHVSSYTGEKKVAGKDMPWNLNIGMTKYSSRHDCWIMTEDVCWTVRIRFKILLRLWVR